MFYIYYLDDINFLKNVNEIGLQDKLMNIVLSIAILRLIMILFLLYAKFKSNILIREYINELFDLIDNSKNKYILSQLINYFDGKNSVENLDYSDFKQLINEINKIVIDSDYSTFSDYIHKKFIKNYVDKELSSNEHNKFLEYIFQYGCIEYIDQHDDEDFKAYFMHYIRVKNCIHSFINSSTDIKGFLEFQYFFKRQNTIYDVASNMFQNIFDVYAYNKVKYLEIRIGHIKFKYKDYEDYSLKNKEPILLQFYNTFYSFADVYQSFLKSSNEMIYSGLVLHFNKRYDDELKCWDNYFKEKSDSYLRYKQYQEECFLNLAVLQYIRGNIPYADNYLIGIDAASNELLTEPWVLAPIFSSVKDKKMKLLLDKADYYGLDIQRSKNLGITYHVGEVFNSFISGLRHIDEVVEYYGFQNGERLGHAIILGLSVDEYMQEHRIVTLPAIELLDNWLWLYHLKSYNSLLNDISIAFIEEKIWEVIHFIYDIDGHLPSHISIHHLFKAYQKQFEGLEFKNLHNKKCNSTFCESNCIFSSESEWDEEMLLYSRHCHCFLKNMVKMVQIDTYNEIYRKIYKEIQEYICQKIAVKGIVIEVNPISNMNIGEFNSIENHPMFKINDSYSFDKNHIMFSINSDDPGVFGTTLRNQFGFIEQILLSKGITMEKSLNWIDTARKNGLNSTFIEKTNKSKNEIIKELETIKNSIKNCLKLENWQDN